MKKTIKRTIRRKCNITTLFHLAEIACLLMCTTKLSSIEFSEDSMFILVQGTKAFIYLALIPVIQTLGAEITRQLCYYKLLKKRNVMRFISEIHRDSMETR